MRATHGAWGSTLAWICMALLCHPTHNAPVPEECADAPICKHIHTPAACRHNVSSFTVADKCPRSCNKCSGGALPPSASASDVPSSDRSTVVEDSWDTPELQNHEFPTFSITERFSFVHIPKVAGASFIRKMHEGFVSKFYPQKEAGQEHCLLYDLKLRRDFNRIVFFRSPRHHVLSMFSECRFDIHWSKVHREGFPWDLPIERGFSKWVDNFYYFGGCALRRSLRVLHAPAHPCAHVHTHTECV